MAPLQEQEHRDFWEICKDRCQMRSTFLTSQLPIVGRHKRIGLSTFAYRILDPQVHNAHRIEGRGESMCKLKAAKPGR